MQDDTLIEKLKYMSKDDLESFALTTKITSGGSALIGIGTLFLTFMFTNLFTITVAAFVCYVFGNIAIASDNIKLYIYSLLAAMPEDK